MRGSLKTVVLLGVIGALILVVARHGGEVTGLGDGALAVYKIGFLILIGGAVLRLLRDRFGEAIQAALIWVIVGLVLVVAYAYRFDLKDASDRVMAELVPGRAVARGQSVEVARANTGDFQIATEVNGALVPMVLDTGIFTAHAEFGGRAVAGAVDRHVELALGDEHQDEEEPEQRRGPEIGERPGNDDGTERIRKDMTEHDPRVACS